MPLDLTTAAGVIAGLVTFIGILLREHQRSDRQMETDRNFWRTLALRGTELADKATDIAARQRDV